MRTAEAEVVHSSLFTVVCCLCRVSCIVVHCSIIVVLQSSQGLGLAIQSSSTIGKEGIYVKTVSPSGPAGEVGMISTSVELHLSFNITLFYHD